MVDRQLSEGKPVLVASRPKKHKREDMPHNLEPSHAYEIVSVAGEKIYLRNPWNRRDPDPISAAEFAANMQPGYATLK